jgi:hypothetical protein
MIIDGVQFIGSGSDMTIDSGIIYSSLIKYYADYSTKYTADSIIDKEYIDNKFFSGVWTPTTTFDPSSPVELTFDLSMYTIFKGIDGFPDVMNFILHVDGTGGINSNTIVTLTPPDGFVINSSSDAVMGSVSPIENGQTSQKDAPRYYCDDRIFVDAVNSSGWKIRISFDWNPIPNGGAAYVITGSAKGTYTAP